MSEELKINPWLKIWTHPRQTIRAIVDYNPKYRFILLSAIYGFPTLLGFAQSLSLGENVSVLAILVGSIILSPFIGMLGIYIATALILWTGKWIGGKATFQTLKAALAWSNVPRLAEIVLWLILVSYFKSTLFFGKFAETALPPSETRIVFTVFFLQMVFSVWSFVILVKGIGEVQGFSAWKGLLNVVIPFVLVGVLAWIFSWLIWVGHQPATTA